MPWLGRRGAKGAMPRQVRIEFDGAFYHLMCRGDRRETIYQDDQDRERFLATLGERVGRRTEPKFMITGNGRLAGSSRSGWSKRHFNRSIWRDWRRAIRGRLR